MSEVLGPATLCSNWIVFRPVVVLTSILINYVNIRMDWVAWITSSEAVAILRVRPQTLYANVSRGRIRVKPDPKDSRRSLYNRDDVKRLADRRPGRRAVATVATSTIDWGDPILPSAISTIQDGRLYYRGIDAVMLSETESLEGIAALLWQADLSHFQNPRSHNTFSPAARSPLNAALELLVEQVQQGLPTHGLSRPALVGHSTNLIGDLYDAMIGRQSVETRPVHIRLAAAWSSTEAEEIIRRALVLLADHELNASTFAARVCASTRAPLSACVLAGLSTLTGPFHGAASKMLRLLLLDAEKMGPKEAVSQWLSRGQPLPTFGQPLYPQGDPRAASLLSLFRTRDIYAEICSVAEDMTGEPPNIDFALAALADAYALPPDAPFIIFALGRVVGWIAHSLEQIETGQLIRPRARYVGPSINR